MTTQNKEKIAMIVYGDGGELGSFKVFADNLQKQLKPRYATIVMEYANRDSRFFDLVDNIDSGQEIEELHIFSHAIGAGLFLGYKDPMIAAKREQVYLQADSQGRKVTYLEAVNTEVGAIQTDDFHLSKYTGLQNRLRSRFSSTAFIKIWGCNSGVDRWVYSDGGVTDPNDMSVGYYWRAFNERNVPKLSIAQAFAKYFNVNVFGARSGASIEVKHKGRWMSSQKFKNKVGHWPSGNLPHRLIPDKGTYYEYKP